MNPRFKVEHFLIEVFFDYVNNYITIEHFAECNGLLVSEADSLIALAREVASRPAYDS